MANDGRQRPFTGPFFRGPILRGTFEGSLRFFEYSLVSNQGASGAARNPSPILFEKSAKEGGDLRRKSFHGSFYRRGRSDTPSRVGGRVDTEALVSYRRGQVLIVGRLEIVIRQALCELGGAIL